MDSAAATGTVAASSTSFKQLEQLNSDSKLLLKLSMELLQLISHAS